ncbi:hypothetical protein EUX98_g5231 [Antrodiella citrinella]|uniref:BHLH domain-containing protein n=1 Tax=Antrodiella citrinella TaxID=2447956 RepID=A0A4S4MUI9_9APHY|nr:hypothetical protein EUX98_g5231 [Antrodiella citrinella]
MVPPTPHSAPANIAFQQSRSPHYGQDLEFAEISPLTSPWLGAYNHNGQPESGMQGGQRQMVPSNSSNQRKRRPSPGSGEEELTTARPPKRSQPAPSNRMTPSMPPLLNNKKSNLRGTRSANSTPLFPAHNSRSSIGGEVPGDTPSPVDLSMPPPAPPSTTSSNSPMQFVESHSTTPPLDMHGQSHNQNMNNQMSQQQPHQQHQQSQQQQPSASAMSSELLMPVTPASIMNLGRLGTNSALAPPPMISPPAPQEKQTRAKSAGRSRASTLSIPSNAKASNSNLPLISPNLKPIRPAGNATSGASTPTTAMAQPTLAGRKTSHKAAEQKRRDSLKTSFDELRILLPPIPLPSDEGYPDEPVLPGAMPPRGPPKGNADGPNRGVSKLQLLRCGNDFIRVLKARVDRRDSEIDILRKEISRLRLVADDNGVNPEGGEEIDLEKEMDAEETAVGGIFARGSVRFGAIAEGDEPDDDMGE